MPPPDQTTVSHHPSRIRDAGKRLEQARRGLDPEERRRVMEAVALRIQDGWVLRFAIMMALSVIVAVMGLSLGSPAVVIGAMLLSPLMTPLMGSAAALAMALPRHLFRSLLIVVISTVVSVLLGFVLAAVLQDQVLSSEVLARTSPDLRDLMVALAAGIAGAYATVRPDVSGALPGVAIAVALVPPLATIGITLQARRGDLVGGAVLLYSANLVAIILVATLVFVVTGFVPRSRLEDKGAHVSGGVVLLTAATVAIAVPLAVASARAADAGNERAKVHDAFSAWNANTGNELDEVRLDGDVVHAKISGPNPPSDSADLERTLTGIMGPSAALEISWTQTRKGSEIAEPAPVDAAELAGVREIVDSWLQAGGIAIYDITGLDVDDDEIVIDLVSADPPPPVDTLSTLLLDELQVAPIVVINWTQRTMLTSVGEAQSATTIRRDIEAVVSSWAEQQPQYVIDDVQFDGERVTVEVRGPRRVDPASLRSAIADLDVVDDDVEIELWWTRRVPLAEPSPTGDDADS